MANKEENMMFSSSNIEKMGQDAYIAGIPYNNNPYVSCEGFINDIKRRLWQHGWRKAENDCRTADY